MRASGVIESEHVLQALPLARTRSPPKALAIFLISIYFRTGIVRCKEILLLRRPAPPPLLLYSIQFSACLYDLSFSVHFIVNSTFYTIFTTIHRLAHMPVCAAAAAAIATSSNHAAKRKRNVEYTHKKGSEVRRRGGGKSEYERQKTMRRRWENLRNEQRHRTPMHNSSLESRQLDFMTDILCDLRKCFALH